MRSSLFTLVLVVLLSVPGIAPVDASDSKQLKSGARGRAPGPEESLFFVIRPKDSLTFDSFGIEVAFDDLHTAILQPGTWVYHMHSEKCPVGTFSEAMILARYAEYAHEYSIPVVRVSDGSKPEVQFTKKAKGLLRHASFAMMHIPQLVKDAPGFEDRIISYTNGIYGKGVSHSFEPRKGKTYFFVVDGAHPLRMKAVPEEQGRSHLDLLRWNSATFKVIEGGDYLPVGNHAYLCEMEFDATTTRKEVQSWNRCRKQVGEKRR